MKRVCLIIGVFLSVMVSGGAVYPQVTAPENNNVAQLRAQLAKAKALNVKLEQKAKEFFQSAIGKENLEAQNAQLNKVVTLLTQEHVVLNKQIEDLKNEIKENMAEEIKSYSEEGNAYMQNNLYDQAMEAYIKVVKMDPNNAQAQLRLGYLYKRQKDEPKEAVYHFKQYLLLQPHADDRKEVEYLIEMLSPQGEDNDRE